MTTDRLRAHENDFTPRELAVFRNIQEFKAEDDGFLSRLKSAVEFPFDKFADSIEGTNAGDLLDSAVQSTVDRMEDASSWSIDRDEIFDDYRQLGHDIGDLADIRRLEIEIVESVVEGLDKKYSNTAFAQGAATGVAGLPGALADIPMVLTVALRAVNDYATHYGYDIQKAPEQQFALLILAAAAASDADERQQALDTLSERIEQLDGAGGEGSADAAEPPIAKVGESVVLRLARGLLAETLPVLGSLASGGMNKLFVNDVCETARHAYQERWLVDRYVD